MEIRKTGEANWDPSVKSKSLRFKKDKVLNIPDFQRMVSLNL